MDRVELKRAQFVETYYRVTYGFVDGRNNFLDAIT